MQVADPIDLAGAYTRGNFEKIGSDSSRLGVH